MGGHLVILTGAGVSAESGLGTFRDKDGLWSKFDWRRLATPEGFAEDPETVHAFYNARRAGLLEAEPNAAHIALAELERAWARAGAGAFTLITQNIDDLHQRAGSQSLIAMHGELLKARCEHCGTVSESPAALDMETPCPACGATGGMRPHVVWFGEIPFGLEDIYAALSGCERFAAIGTSGAVYPAAGFVQEAKAAGARTIELSLEPGEVSFLFDEHIYGPATEVVPAWAGDLHGRLP